MHTDIIIVNWNAGLQLSQAVASINNNHNLVASVVVVDNASTDDSLMQLGTLGRLPFDLRIIRNTENRGFGAACNQAARLCKSPFVLFLNPDSRLFHRTLQTALDFMQRPENSKIGICGVQLIDEDGRIAHSCARFPTFPGLIAHAVGLDRVFPGLGHFMAEWDHTDSRPVDHVIGAFFLIRRGVFEALKGFDERFFMYLEDLDFSLRARDLGWDSFYLTETQAFHAGGGTSRQVKAKRLFYSLRSRLLYGLKHFSLWQAGLLLGIILVVEPLSRSLFSLLRGGIRDVRNTWIGYGMLYQDLPNILGKSNRSRYLRQV